MSNRLNVCFVINSNYVGQVKVAIKSLFDANKGRDILIIIVHSGLTNEEVNNLELFVNKHKQQVVFKYFDTSIFSNLSKMRNDTSYAAYIKAFLPYLLTEYNKVIYLDCDLVVNRDVSELFDYEQSHFLGAVVDKPFNKKNSEHVKLITGFETDKYFNSGVMVFDYGHKDEIVKEKDVLDYISSHKDIILFHDQDILNHFYCSKYEEYGDDYNHLAVYSSPKEILFHSNKTDSVIIHYANWKPWNSNYIGKYYKKYLKVYRSIQKEEQLQFLKRRNVFSMIRLMLKYVFRIFKRG